jgi:lipopolysaccharide export system protein LptA
VEGGMTTTAASIRISRASSDLSAQGEVKTTYSELKPQPGGALLATGDPIHVTARSMSAQRATGTARYFDARLWQGANIVQGPIIDFQREPRKVEAHGEDGRRITTVFVEQGSSGKVTPVNVSAAALTYVDAQRQAHFEGGVVIRGADTVVTAGRVDVFLQARTQNRSAGMPGSPSQVDHIVASGRVVIQQQNRRATGEKLVYTVSDGKFVLTGGPPSIFDAEHGQITGDSLTFFSRDDRVLVESINASPTVTQTRIAK